MGYQIDKSINRVTNPITAEGQSQSRPPTRPRPQQRRPLAPVEEEEPDTEHEVRGEEEERQKERVFHWSVNVSTQVTIRVNQLARSLKTKRIGRPATEGPEIDSDFEEGEEAHKFQEELETLLKKFEEDEIGVNEQSEYLPLERPILQLLTQSRSFRICRRDLFCPDESCIQTGKFRTLGQLTNHTQSKHGAIKEETADMFRYFIQRMLPMEIEMKVMTNEEREVQRDWNSCRCHFPGCTYINMKAYMVDSYVRGLHKETKKDMKTLGWFWGTLHTMIKENPKMTIAGALGQGHFWECKMEGCHQPFQSQKAMGHHFSQAHAAHMRKGWKGQSRRLNQTWKTVTREESDEDTQNERREERREEVHEENESTKGRAPPHQEPPPIRTEKPEARARAREGARMDHNL
jgi:hypothetical protein